MALSTPDQITALSRRAADLIEVEQDLAENDPRGLKADASGTGSTISFGYTGENGTTVLEPGAAKFLARAIERNAQVLLSSLRMVLAEERGAVARELHAIANKLEFNHQLPLPVDDVGRVDDYVPCTLSDARRLERELGPDSVCWVKSGVGLNGPWEVVRPLPETDEQARTGDCFTRLRHIRALSTLDTLAAEASGHWAKKENLRDDLLGVDCKLCLKKAKE